MSLKEVRFLFFWRYLNFNVHFPKGLPKHNESIMAEFELVWKRNRQTDIKPVVLMATFVSNEKQASELCIQWKMSNFDKTLCCFIANHRTMAVTESVANGNQSSLKPYKDLIIRKGGSHIVELVLQLMLYQGRAAEEVDKIRNWVIPKFPITGADLKATGVKPGPTFGRLMTTVKEVWIESGFVLTKDLLLVEINRLLKT